MREFIPVVLSHADCGHLFLPSGAEANTPPQITWGSAVSVGRPRPSSRGNPRRSPLSRIPFGFKIHSCQPVAPFLLDSGVQFTGLRSFCSAGL